MSGKAQKLQNSKSFERSKTLSRWKHALILSNSNFIHLHNRKKAKYFPWLGILMNRNEPTYFLIYDFKIRTNFTLSSGVSFITGTYIRWNTCSTILALWIANSWNNQLNSYSFIYLFGLKFSFFFFILHEECAYPSKKSLNFNNIRNTFRVFCNISTYKYTSFTLRFEP